MFRRSVGDTSKQPYFHLSACRRSSGAGIQSAIQGEWVFTRRIEDCAKPPAPGVSQAALVFVSNLPTRDHNQFYRYWGIYHPVRNAVRGTGVPVSVYGPAGTLKGTIHMPYRTAILSGPMLHEHLHAWANWAVPTAREAHWGFSSANGQLGGFDLDNLVNHGGGRYSAGRFGTYAAGGNSVPYSPIELYFAGFIPPWEVPDLWVAKDGQWTDEQDASDNWIFSASDIETWSVQRIVAEHGARVPDWTSSQKSFRAAVVLLADEQFPATPTILRELADAVRTFGHPGPDSSRLFNFWEATGGRATLKMDDLRSGAIDADWAPVPVGSLASVRLAAGGAAAEVDVAAAFRDPDGDALTYRAISSAPSVAAVSVFGTTVSVTPVAEGTSTLTVTATDPGGLSATQAFTATVSAPENRPPEPVGALPPLTLGVDDPAVAVEVGRRVPGPGRRSADLRGGLLGAGRGGGGGSRQHGDGDADGGGHGDSDGDGHRRRRLQRGGDADVHGDGGPGRGAPFHRRPHRARGDAGQGRPLHGAAGAHRHPAA